MIIDRALLGSGLQAYHSILDMYTMANEQKIGRFVHISPSPHREVEGLHL